MLEINQQALIGNKPESVHSLYDKHAGMLLGYIFGIVKDRQIAEECLVQIFCELSKQFNQINWEDTSIWCQLQRFAKEKLAGCMEAVGECEIFSSPELVKQVAESKYLERLTDEQKIVFCDVYYRGKSISAISIELNRTEDLIRKSLKEAFAIIRNCGKN